MIHTPRALALLAALILALTLAVAFGGRPAAPPSHALIANLDTTTITSLAWTSAESPLRADRTGDHWQVNGTPADATTIDAVLTALRGGTWHRERTGALQSPIATTLAITTPTSTTMLRLPAIGGADSPVPGQTWLAAGSRVLLVDDWILRALAPSTTALVAPPPPPPAPPPDAGVADAPVPDTAPSSLWRADPFSVTTFAFTDRQRAADHVVRGAVIGEWTRNGKPLDDTRAAAASELAELLANPTWPATTAPVRSDATSATTVALTITEPDGKTSQHRLRLDAGAATCTVTILDVAPAPFVAPPELCLAAAALISP